MLAKEIIELTGVTKKGLEYYEKKGLIHPNRLASNYRDYSNKDVLMIKKIQLLRHLNFSTEDIDKILNEHNEELYSKKIRQTDREIYNLQTNKLYLQSLLDNDTETELILTQLNEDRQLDEPWIKPRTFTRRFIGYLMTSFSLGTMLIYLFPNIDFDMLYTLFFIGVLLIQDRVYHYILCIIDEIKLKLSK